MYWYLKSPEPPMMGASEGKATVSSAKIMAAAAATCVMSCDARPNLCGAVSST